MLAANAPWWAGEFGSLAHNSNDTRLFGTGANAGNFGQPPNVPEGGGSRPRPVDNTNQGQPQSGAPQTPLGGWAYNTTNPTPAPAPIPQRSATGQAQSAPLPASGNRIGGWPDSQGQPGTKNYTPAPTTGYDKPGTLGDITQYQPQDLHDKVDAWAKTMPTNSRGDTYGTKYFSDVGASRPAASNAPAYSMQSQSQSGASSQPARNIGTPYQAPAAQQRPATAYTRPDGYAPNSTVWSQHAPTPDPAEPTPPPAAKIQPNVYGTMSQAPATAISTPSPGYSTIKQKDQATGNWGPEMPNGAMTMDANTANPYSKSYTPPPPPQFTSTGIDGKPAASMEAAFAGRDALITRLQQQQSVYSGSNGKDLGKPTFTMPNGFGQSQTHTASATSANVAPVSPQANSPSAAATSAAWPSNDRGWHIEGGDMAVPNEGEIRQALYEGRPLNHMGDSSRSYNESIQSKNAAEEKRYASEVQAWNAGTNGVNSNKNRAPKPVPAKVLEPVYEQMRGHTGQAQSGPPPASEYRQDGRPDAPPNAAFLNRQQGPAASPTPLRTLTQDDRLNPNIALFDANQATSENAKKLGANFTPFAYDKSWSIPTASEAPNSQRNPTNEQRYNLPSRGVNPNIAIFEANQPGEQLAAQGGPPAQPYPYDPSWPEPVQRTPANSTGNRTNAPVYKFRTYN